MHGYHEKLLELQDLSQEHKELSQATSWMSQAYKELEKTYAQDMAANADLDMNIKKTYDEYKNACNLMALHTSNEDYQMLKQINLDLREKLRQTRQELKNS